MDDEFMEESIKWLEQRFAEAERKQDNLRHERLLFLKTLMDARLKKHLSQTDLARLIKQPQSVISRIESGKGNPSLNTLLTIAKTLDVHLVVE